MLLEQIAYRVAFGRTSGQALDMVFHGKDRKKAVEALSDYSWAWSDAGGDGLPEETNPFALVQAVIKKVTGTNQKIESESASADGMVHELEHVLLDREFVLNAGVSPKNSSDSFMDEIVISALWKQAFHEAPRNAEDVARSLYGGSGDGEISSEEILKNLESDLPQEKNRRNLLKSAIRQVRSETRDLSTKGNVYKPNPAITRLIEIMFARIDFSQGFMPREWDESFKRAYLLIQAMSASWTKKLADYPPPPEMTDEELAEHEREMQKYLDRQDTGE